METDRAGVDRSNHISPYQDHEPEVMSDGVWTYAYFQEGARPEDRDRYFTNRALIECQRECVPIGVLRQTRTSPASRYLILGLAIVRDWQDGYFLLEGLPSNGGVPHSAEAQASTFTPTSQEDARQWIRTAIARRRGQPRFRAELIQAYEGQCAVTGCVAIDALEAAHGGPLTPRCFSLRRYLRIPPWLLPTEATTVAWGSHPQGKRAFPRRTLNLGYVNGMKQGYRVDRRDSSSPPTTLRLSSIASTRHLTIDRTPVLLAEPNACHSKIQ